MAHTTTNKILNEKQIQQKKARLLTLCLFTVLAILCGGMIALSFSLEQSANASEAQDGTQDSQKLTQSQPDCPNSWRYVNGERIYPTQSGSQDSQNSQGMTNSQDTNSLSSEANTSNASNTLSDTWSDYEADSTYFRGIDVSQWQGSIDWQSAKDAGVQFAIIRCGWGNNDTSQDDAYWQYNVSECERLNIPYGVYLYSYAHSTAEAQSEAEHVIRLLQGHSPRYPVYYDLEESSLANDESKQLLAEMSTTFCNAVQGAGYTPGIYANLTWREKYLTDPCFDNWDMWIAQWSSACTYNGDYHLWQCSSDGEVAGVNGRVDIDIDYKTKMLSSNAYDVIYNHDYYIANNPDVAAAFSGDRELTEAHFVSYGMKEGRVASPAFNVTYYKNKYSDLQNIYGNDLTQYYFHFVSSGISEMRQGSEEFNVEYYLRNYSDLRDVYDTNYISYARHYVQCGKSEGRVANALTSGALSEDAYDNWLAGDNIEPSVQISEAMNNTIKVTITYKQGERGAASNVLVPAWSTESGQDDLVWHQATKQSDGSWVCSIDLAQHNLSTGEYSIDVYQNIRSGAQELVGSYTTTVSVSRTVIYRMYNPITSEHLFTTDKNEYDTLVNYDWVQEGVGWNSKSIGTPVYRLYNSELGHLYTKDSNEVAVLSGTDGNPGCGWSFEGTIFISTDGDAGSSAIYRLYNAGLVGQHAPGQHHYTLDSNEYNELIAFHGWAGEQTAFFGYAV